MINLWPNDISDTTDVSPVSIMREQAHLLGEKTKNLVIADVSRGSFDSQNFVYHFYIVAPPLNNYRYRLFTIEHGIEMYPLTVYMDEALGIELSADKLAKTQTEIMQDVIKSISFDNDRTKLSERYVLIISSEETFLEVLNKILNSNRTRQVIRSLLSQVNPD
jgi:hypothetical protein